MKQNDKRLWHKCGSAINRLFLWLFIAFAILLAVDLWILLISAIVVLFDYSATLLLVIKILSAYAIVLVIFSHIALWQIMYSPNIYNRLISIVWHKRIRLLIYLSLGYFNVYLLNLYFIRFRYTQYELLQYRINVGYSALIMIPVANIIVYCAALRGKNQLSVHDATRLYLKGRLATYLIKSNYKELIYKGA